MAPSYATDIQVDWDVPQLRWYSRLAESWTLISFDRRGGGASDRDVEDHSLEAQIADLEAVVKWSGVTRFPLLGAGHSGLVAIAYAARQPDQVSHLMLFQAFADAAAFLALPKIQAARALLAKDWRAFLETSTFYEHGWRDRKSADAIAGQFGEKTTQQRMLDEYSQIESVDVTGLLPLVEAPTLVLHRRRAPYPPLEFAKVMASGISQAQLVLLEGEATAAWDSDSEEVVQMMEAFTAVDAEVPGATGHPVGGASHGLTDRELEVVRLTAAGHSNKEIAASLSLSVHTIERHLANIYAKLGARGRADVTAYAHKNHLV
jgi:DNA-binding CsgD family transcriptional regulator/pimeloyl-ACP methyl ester carboxylesterase